MSVTVHTENGDVELFESEYEIEWVVDGEWAAAHLTQAVAILPDGEIDGQAHCI